MKYLFLIIIVLILSNSSKAIDTSSVQFYPLAVGNAFIYNYFSYSYPNYSSYIIKYSITREAIFNSKKYYLSIRFPQLDSSWIRTDTITGSLYLYNPLNNCPFYQYESLIDSLSAVPNDTIRNCAKYYICKEIYSQNIFGLVREAKTFKFSRTMLHSSETGEKTFIKGIGLSKNKYSGQGVYISGGYEYNLKGCVINSIVYGDTSTIITGITELSNNVTKVFNLSQNYPNPFNPTTTIRFDIPKSSFVKLSIYDISGKEIEPLVNEELNEGSYEVKWNGSNYSSGIYFYKIEAENSLGNSEEKFFQTKRMILIK